MNINTINKKILKFYLICHKAIFPLLDPLISLLFDSQKVEFLLFC
jgi:hypothetical protein